MRISEHFGTPEGQSPYGQDRAGAKATAYLVMEVLVSLAILSIGLLSIVKSFSRAIEASQHSLNYTDATFLADELLNRLESGEDFEKYRGELRKRTRLFNWQIELATTKNPNLKKAMVSIFWKEKGREYQIELSTIFPKGVFGEEI